ncbi:hypothetical protein B0H14DRAFT_3767378 [Mycena olivaceomarginata]|nr:hypothetical protein B0H14DRAFT_3767378 [Mycena olivaceomarginata]
MCLGFTTVAATTAGDIAASANLPFLGEAATLTLSIVQFVKCMSSAGDKYSEIMEQIHENFSAIIVLYETTQIDGILPPEFLSEIAKFAEYVQLEFKAVWHVNDTSEILAPDTYLHRGVSQVTAITGIRMNAEQTHQELLVFLAAHPDITNSDSSSSASVALSGPTNSSESITLLPPVPKIFHGRESELEEVVGLLKQDSPRISILAISSHVGFTQVKSSRGIYRHFVCSEASFLVLDNLETTWEPKRSRSEVEQFLSLLADVPQLALLITMGGTEKPAHVKWTRPFPHPLKPLSDFAAFQMFVDIADDHYDRDSVQELLNLTSNLPLAVSLIANVVAYEGCDRTLSRWIKERTHLLSDGYDQKSNLDISIMLSYSSSRNDLWSSGAPQPTLPIA